MEAPGPGGRPAQRHRAAVVLRGGNCAGRAAAGDGFKGYLRTIDADGDIYADGSVHLLLHQGIGIAVAGVYDIRGISDTVAARFVLSRAAVEVAS